MAEDNEVIGIQFGTQGLNQVQSDLRSYQSSLQKVAEFQNKFAQQTMQAANEQMRAAQQSRASYEQQIRDAQRAYEAKVVEAREFARATREKIADYRLEATAAENTLRSIIASLRARAQAEGLSASELESVTKSKMALETQLANLRRKTETEVEDMRLRERQSLDKITAEADKYLTKRRQLEDEARKGAQAERADADATKEHMQAVQAATKAIDDQAKAVDKQIKEADKLADAQKKAFNKEAVQAQKDALKQSEEQAKKSADAYRRFTDVVGTLNPRMGFLAKSAGDLSGKMLLFTAAVTASIAVVLALSGAVFSLGKAMYGLGAEGNAALETISTFSNVVNSALQGTEQGGAGNLLGGIQDELKGATQGARGLGKALADIKPPNLAGDFLQQLREQTRGTISDIELMRLTLRALQGTTLEFRQVVAPALGEIFDATARIARATGQSAEAIREKFIFGLRRMENRLLDDIGVKVDAVKANEAYAASIGKTVEQLSAQEKQIAFTQEAVKQLKVAAGELGDPNATVENIARIQATIENIRLKMQLALAPFADVVSSILSQIVGLASVFIEYIAPAVKTVSENFKGLFQDLNDAGLGFNNILPVVQLAAKIFVIFLAVINDTITGIRKLINIAKVIPEAFNEAFLGIPKKILGVFTGIKTLSSANIEQLAYLMAYGGGAIIGAFAEGLYSGMKPVVTAVTAIANLVADFLMGFSPPKKGPLHTIDKGAFNVGKAWVDGFLKGLLEFEERSDVLNMVNARLGDIGKFNMEQVEAGLLRLDIALRPYQERLEIVKADMEALTGYIDPALDALERIQDRSIRALKYGQGDVEALRTLDRQVLALQRIQDLRQDAVDQATVQLAMAQSQQIQERTLLMIQKRRLEMGAKDADKEKTGSDKAGSGGPDNPYDENMGTMPGGGPLPPPEELLKDFELPTVSDDIFRGLSEGFFDTTTIDNDISGFKDAMKRIDDANPGAKTKEKLSGLTQAFTDIVAPIRDTMASIFSLDGDSILAGALLNLSGFDTSVADSLMAVFGMGDDSSLSTAKNNVSTFVTDTNAEFTKLLTDLTGDGGFSSQIDLMMKFLFGPLTDVDNVLGSSWFNLDWFIREGKNSFQTFIDFLKGDFQLGATLDQTIVAPVKGVLNELGTAIEIGIINVVRGINVFLSSIPEVIGLGTIKEPPPGFITNLFKAEKGAMGVRGLGLVGEKGPELIAPSRNVDIFPTNATQAIVRMSQMMARNPGSQVIVLPNRGGGNNSSTTNTFAPVFNMAGSRDNIMLRARQLYASMR